MNHDLLADVRSHLLAAGKPPSPESVMGAVRAQGHVVGSSNVIGVVARLRSDLLGFGPLEGLIEAPGVTDVLVNGPDEVWVDRGNGLETTGLRFVDEVSLRQLVQRLASGTGRRVDDAHPFVDAQLPAGVRMHAILPPVSSKLCLSLRIARKTGFTLDELVALQTVHPDLAPVLESLVHERHAFVISGGTGSGKTTVLASLLALADPSSRLVIVEDTTELRPVHPHVINLEARPPNVEGKGEIALSVLVRQALRMRPDRLVVGEARGAEVVDLLTALNTGHEGGCATLHANKPSDVPARVEALCAMAGIERHAAHSQFATAINNVIHLSRRLDGSRYVSELARTVREADGSVHCRPEWCVDAEGEIWRVST